MQLRFRSRWTYAGNTGSKVWKLDPVKPNSHTNEANTSTNATSNTSTNAAANTASNTSTNAAANAAAWKHEYEPSKCDKQMMSICSTRSYDAPDCASRNECITPACDEYDKAKDLKTHTEKDCQVFFKKVCPEGSNVFYCLANPLSGSSLRLKHDIQPLAINSEPIYDMNLVSFKYNANNFQSHGMIAEEVEQLIPEIVIKDNEGLPAGIMYEWLPILMLNEMKKLKNRVDELEAKLAQ